MFRTCMLRAESFLMMKFPVFSRWGASPHRFVLFLQDVSLLFYKNAPLPSTKFYIYIKKERKKVEMSSRARETALQGNVFPPHIASSYF